tara:strand:+ start:2145 stop:3056 length:912 start_codon:yes stop_codon:yes gene_type:complete
MEKQKFLTPKPISFSHRGTNYLAIFDSFIEEDKKGFLSHNLTIFDKDSNTISGYLKTFYIDDENIDTYYPSIPYFLSTKMNINIGLRHTDQGNNGKPWDLKNLDEKIETLSKLLFFIDKGSYSFFKKDCEEEKPQESYIDKLFTEISKQLEKTEYKKQFDSFKKSHQLKPMPEHIHISDGIRPALVDGVDRNLPNLSNFLSSINKTIEECNKPNFDYRKKGLGTILYKLTADWMGSNNLNLYIGGTNNNSNFFWDQYFYKSKDFKIQETKSGRKFLCHKYLDNSYLYENQKPSQESKKNIKPK